MKTKSEEIGLFHMGFFMELGFYGFGLYHLIGGLGKAYNRCFESIIRLKQRIRKCRVVLS